MHSIAGEPLAQVDLKCDENIEQRFQEALQAELRGGHTEFGQGKHSDSAA